MLLMVSVQNLPEAHEALRGGADIVDVKNLQEALVGSAEPGLVKEVRETVPAEQHASVTLGVVPNQVGTVAMAVYTAGLLNATSVKVGFMRSSHQEAVEILRASKRALDGFETKLIGSLFADNLENDGLEPRKMVDIAKESECDGWLIDTLTKDGRNLFDFMPEVELRDMVFEGKELGMSTALSGHLKLDNLDELARINPDIVGVRGAVCSKGDRNDGVYWEAVANFKHQIDLRQSGEIDVRNGNHLADNNGSIDTWVVIDGTGKTCASILSELTAQIRTDSKSFVEVIVPGVLNSYDVLVWAENGNHRILTQRKDKDGSMRILIQP
tara:strand:- start:929 stop:1909 length:981 start_codon:yes stop_codon:yes gene_type:complete